MFFFSEMSTPSKGSLEIHETKRRNRTHRKKKDGKCENIVHEAETNNQDTKRSAPLSIENKAPEKTKTLVDSEPLKQKESAKKVDGSSSSSSSLPQSSHSPSFVYDNNNNNPTNNSVPIRLPIQESPLIETKDYKEGSQWAHETDDYCATFQYPLCRNDPLDIISNNNNNNNSQKVTFVTVVPKRPCVRIDLGRISGTRIHLSPFGYDDSGSWKIVVDVIHRGEPFYISIRFLPDTERLVAP